MRRLYIIQHGKSYPKEVDPERRLTEEGIKETEAVAKILGEKGVKVAKIFHSGKIRARMTAEILSRYIKAGEIVETDGLNPLDDPVIWFNRLKNYTEDIMLVGHLPHLSKLVTILLNTDREVVKIRYSGVLCLGDEEGRWIILWYITPDII